MAKASDNEFPSVLFDEQASAPTTPASGFWRAYLKSDGFYIVDDVGTETGPLIDETAHDLLDHTGLTGVGGGSGSAFASIVIADVEEDTVRTVNINSTSYVASATRAFYVDFDLIAWTHFSIQLWGQSNAAGQTITLQVQTDQGGATPLSASGNDLTITNSSAWFSTGWVAISASFTGLHRLVVAAKGSNSTVDLSLLHLSVCLKG